MLDKRIHVITGDAASALPVMRSVERRNLVRRSQITQRLIESVVKDPYSAVTVDVIRDGLEVPPEAAKRLLLKLARAGILEQSSNGVWVRSPYEPARKLTL